MVRRCTGVILAGGRAARFGGRAKGLEEVGGRRIVDRVAGALRQVTDELLLVANANDATQWLAGVRCIRDHVEGRGPLAGVASAFAEIVASDNALGAGGGGTGALVVGWDMPFVSASLLGELRAKGERGGKLAVVPEGAEGRLEPLCAWYDAGRCLATAERRLVAEELSMRAFLDELDPQVLPLERVLDWGSPSRLFVSVNSVEDLDAARRMASVTA